MPSRDPERQREYRRRWDQAHRAEYQRQYRKEHPDKWTEKQRIAARAKRLRLRQELLALFGWVCQRCGFDDPRALQIDHVDGGGVAHIASFTSTYKYYAHVLASGGVGFQLLCANCNAIKRAENGEHGNRCRYP